MYESVHIHAASISLPTSSLNDTFDGVPWHQFHILCKYLDVEERYCMCATVRKAEI